MTSSGKHSSTSTKFSDIQFRLDYPRLLDELELETTEYHGELWCPCPLPFGNHSHGDRSASFSINIEHPKKTGLYNCFVCGGGNIIQLVSHLKQIVYSDAEQWVDQFVAGVEENFEKELEFALDSKKQIDDNTPMPVYNPCALFNYTQDHPWFAEQGLTHEALEHFMVGYDDEHDTVLFPHWWMGKLVGWQSRDMSGNRKAKYLNTTAFPKRNTLFNYDGCREYDSVVVVESPKTVVKLWGLGFKNVVATFGAEVNPEQMTSLWAFDKVYLWFDNDPAGTKAYRTATQYLRQNVDLWLVPPVNQEKGDPGDLTSLEEVQEYMSRAKSVLEMELR